MDTITAHMLANKVFTAMISLYQMKDCLLGNYREPKDGEVLLVRAGYRDRQFPVAGIFDAKADCVRTIGNGRLTGINEYWLLTPKIFKRAKFGKANAAGDEYWREFVMVDDGDRDE